MRIFDGSQHIAVFGGSFDPPHLGHLEALKSLQGRFHFKHLMVVPTGTHPFKSNAAEVEHRLAMTRLNFSDARGIEVSDLEKNDPLSASFETLQRVRKLTQSQKIAFVIGVELLGELPRWAHFPQILLECDWIVLRRKSPNLSNDFVAKMLSDSPISPFVRSRLESGGDIYCETSSGNSLNIVTTNAPEISSTALREDIARKGVESLTFQTFIHPLVKQYIQQHQLYGMGLQ